VIRHDNEPYEKYPDNCERCAGTFGGVRGNENRYPIEGGGYRVLCDYCSVEVDRGLPQDFPCSDCTRPLGEHVLMHIDTVETNWVWMGISLTICSGVAIEHPVPSSLLLVRIPNDKPDDPCDEDFMKDISS
jgi:hypothetical protein